MSYTVNQCSLFSSVIFPSPASIQNLAFMLLNAPLASFLQTLVVLLLLWDVLRKSSVIDVITMHHLSLPR